MESIHQLLSSVHLQDFAKRDEQVLATVSEDSSVESALQVLRVCRLTACSTMLMISTLPGGVSTLALGAPGPASRFAELLPR